MDFKAPKLLPGNVRRRIDDFLWRARSGPPPGVSRTKVNGELLGTKKERQRSAEIDEILGIAPTVKNSGYRTARYRPVEILVLAFEPETSSLLQRLKDVAEAGAPTPLKLQVHDTSSEIKDVKGQNKKFMPLTHVSQPKGGDTTEIARELLAICTSLNTEVSYDYTDVDLIAAS